MFCLLFPFAGNNNGKTTAGGKGIKTEKSSTSLCILLFVPSFSMIVPNAEMCLWFCTVDSLAHSSPFTANAQSSSGYVSVRLELWIEGPYIICFKICDVDHKRTSTAAGAFVTCVLPSHQMTPAPFLSTSVLLSFQGEDGVEPKDTQLPCTRDWNWWKACMQGPATHLCSQVVTLLPARSWSLGVSA